MLNHFVTRGMLACCDQGSQSNYLNTERGHGFYYKGQPVLNANDHKGFVGFGTCKKRKEKAEIGAKDPSNGAAVLNPQLYIKMMEKCKPCTATPWKHCNERFLIEGAPALLQESTCYCTEEGTITIEPVVIKPEPLKPIEEENS